MGDVIIKLQLNENQIIKRKVLEKIYERPSFISEESSYLDNLKFKYT